MNELGVLAAPDIVEKTEWGFYLGYFEKGTDETGVFNCMIVEMRTVGMTTTKKYAKGINYNAVCTWAERANYEYKFGARNIQTMDFHWYFPQTGGGTTSDASELETVTITVT